MADDEFLRDRTLRMEKRLERNGKIDYVDGAPYYKGRHVISSTTKINGGVYLGASGREAIVVDSKKYPELGRIYETAMEKASSFDEPGVLRAVFDTVGEEIMYDPEAVNEILNRAGITPDRKISLDVFIKKGAGVCRHQALACGALIEMFRDKGILNGTPSVERNRSRYGAHVWCAYRNGDAWILDITNNCFGLLKDFSSFMKRYYSRDFS